MARSISIATATGPGIETFPASHLRTVRPPLAPKRRIDASSAWVKPILPRAALSALGSNGLAGRASCPGVSKLRLLLGSRWGKVGLALVILNEIRGLIVVALVLWGWHGR